MYPEQVLSYKHPDEALVEAGLSFNVLILAGNLQAFTTCRPQLRALSCSRHSGLYSAFVWLNIFVPRGFIPSMALSWINP